MLEPNRNLVIICSKTVEMWRLENPHMYLAILRFLFSQIAKFSQKNKIGAKEEPHDENILWSDAECEIPVYFCVRTHVLPPSTST